MGMTKEERRQMVLNTKPIKVKIGTTDLQIMKEFVELTDEMGLYDWDINNEGFCDKQFILKSMRSFCNDVSWFNKDKNPYEMEVK